ncbi:DUF6461 domain-containing protein [Nonomuraea muscovyensis]|uniref:DUF6461 domain-containing protein n=1 Tax=Nonomuraea muscovyensis TaxID=1124761 RepID=UPI0033EA3E88
MIHDPLKPFRWLVHDDCWWSPIVCVSFLRGVGPAEVVRRFGGTSPGRREEFEVFDDLVYDFVQATDGGEGSGHVGVIEAGGWSVAIEPHGWSAALREVATRLSRDGAELVVVSRHDHAEHTFLHARDGAVLTEFIPHSPDRRHGCAPDALNDLMREVGLDPDYEADDDTWPDLMAGGVTRAFALAAKITGVVLEPEHLAGPLYVGAINDLV